MCPFTRATVALWTGLSIFVAVRVACRCVIGPRRYPLRGPYNLDASLLLGDYGRRNPTLRLLGPHELVQAVRTPAGPGTMQVRVRPAASEVAARAWGPGGAWLLDVLAQLLGLDDEPPRWTGPLGRIQARCPGVRLTRVVDLADFVIHYVLRQRVAWRDAVTSQLSLLSAYGEPAPGPGGLKLPLAPSQWRALSLPELAGHGLEQKRARTIMTVAARARHIASWAELAPAEFARRLQSLRGVGPWTRAMVQGYGLGDADVLPPDDHDLPNVVAWVLAGEPRANDARMAELLEPYRGHRFRVIKLLTAAGIHAPRFGPRIRGQRPS